MAWDQTSLDAIEQAISDGERRVRLDDREIEYQSISQMLKARDEIKNYLAKQASESLDNKSRMRHYRAKMCKGL